MEMITDMDFAVLDWIQSVLRCTVLDWLMTGFSYLAEGGAVWIVLGVVLLFFRKTRAAGAALLASLLIGWVIGGFVIKPLVQRVRPCNINTDVLLAVKRPSSYSFPSGHSITSGAAAAVMLATHRKIGWAVLPVALLVMFSRLYHYVHYPTDVLAGALLGVLTAVVVLLIMRKTGLERKLSPHTA